MKPVRAHATLLPVTQPDGKNHSTFPVAVRPLTERRGQLIGRPLELYLCPSVPTERPESGLMVALRSDHNANLYMPKRVASNRVRTSRVTWWPSHTPVLDTP